MFAFRVILLKQMFDSLVLKFGLKHDTTYDRCKEKSS